MVRAEDFVVDFGGGNLAAERLRHQEIVYAPPGVPLVGVHAVNTTNFGCPASHLGTLLSVT